MKTFLIIILILLNCCATKKSQIYICGDHPCVDKKEMKDYFKNNISIDVYTITSDQEKKQSLDLVELNLLKDDIKKGKNINKSLSNKQNKRKLKEILDERKNRKEITKVDIKNDKLKKIPSKKTLKLDKTKKSKKKSSVRFVRLCKTVDECDIDKISKIIMDMGKEKPFPDINTR